MEQQILTIEQAETKIRQIVLNEYLGETDKAIIDKKIVKIINETTENLKVKDLKKATAKSLLNFYKKYFKTLRKTLNTEMKKQSVVYYLLSKGDTKRQTLDETFKKMGYDNSRELGVPNKIYSKTYTKEFVKPLIDELSHEYALDTDDLGGRNSLRNRAEMEIRYQGHQDNIDELKSKGCKLVIASSHADCSERCSQWQGRVFSLDGTSGTTDDGRKYIPLEIATDIYYTTKKGKRYKNGLLGFNCRHYLMAYEKGKKPMQPSPKKQAEERATTEKQRAYERAIRQTQIKVMTAKQLDRTEYLKEKQRAKEMIANYKTFCLDNNRPIETERIKVI